MVFTLPAPSGDDILSPKDAIKVLEELDSLVEAQYQLAKEVEAAHFPNRASIRPEPPEASNGIYNCLNVFSPAI